MQEWQTVDSQAFEVVQNDSGWILRRQDRTPLVEFPTRRQAVRAAIAVCRDEGVTRLLVRRADGRVEEVDATLALDA